MDINADILSDIIARRGECMRERLCATRLGCERTALECVSLFATKRLKEKRRERVRESERENKPHAYIRRDTHTHTHVHTRIHTHI